MTAQEDQRRHLALYAGSFDPITYGHLDVLRRARHLFDELVLGAARELCSGRLVSILEGGYELDSLARCVAAHVKALSRL